MYPARAVQFLKCNIVPENYRSFISDVVSTGSIYRTFPFSVVKKLNLSRLSTAQLEDLLSYTKKFHGLVALDMHLIDWDVSSSARFQLASMKWVTKLHLSVVGFSTLEDFASLLYGFEALQHLKVYMPRFDVMSTPLESNDHHHWEPRPRRQLTQLHLMDFNREFMGCILSLFTAQRLVILGSLWDHEGTWEQLQSHTLADVKELEFASCQDILTDARTFNTILVPSLYAQRLISTT